MDIDFPEYDYDFQAAINFAPSAFVISDPAQNDTPIVYANPAFLELTGYTFEEVVGRNCRFLQGPNTDQAVVECLREAIRAEQPIRTEILNYRKNGTPFWTDLAINPTRSASGGVTSFIGVLTDISARKQAESAQAEAETRLSRIVDNMPGYIFQRIRHSDGSVEFSYLSASFSEIIGLPDRRVATGDDLLSHIHPSDVEVVGRGIERSAADLSRLVLEFRLISEGGNDQWIRTYSTPERLPNGSVIWNGVGINVTAEKEVELRLAYLADHDPLTGLANRTMISRRISADIAAMRGNNSQVEMSHLLLVDLAEINETLGTEDGDAVLRGIGARLDEIASENQSAIAARVGSAEFAIVRKGKDLDVNEFAHRIQSHLAQPIIVGREALTVECCVGTAVLNSGDLPDLLPDGAAAELIKRAGLALSAALKNGSGSHRIYDEEIDHRRRHRMILRHSLRSAIEGDRLELHYQPLVDLQSGKIVSAEALVRWQHPDLGILRPDLFIPLAEESGLIDALSEWVLRTAMRQAKAWEAKGFKVPRIAVNVSSVQFASDSFLESMRSIVEEVGADPGKFELEITESVLLEQSPETMSALLALKVMGFQIAIDDFGAGHASFQYLRNFPIDKLKIDQMFVRQLRVDSADAMIIQAIGSLARGLRLEMVAEGIETEQQRDFLRDQGCSTGQGYFFSMPLSAEDFGWMVENEIKLPYRPLEQK